jgi:hypothetical protein
MVNQPLEMDASVRALIYSGFEENPRLDDNLLEEVESIVHNPDQYERIANLYWDVETAFYLADNNNSDQETIAAYRHALNQLEHALSDYEDNLEL